MWIAVMFRDLVTSTRSDYQSATPLRGLQTHFIVIHRVARGLYSKCSFSSPVSINDLRQQVIRGQACHRVLTVRSNDCDSIPPRQYGN